MCKLLTKNKAVAPSTLSGKITFSSGVLVRYSGGACLYKPGQFSLFFYNLVKIVF
jgi:hypothetical protein